MSGVKLHDYGETEKVRAKDLSRVCDELGVLPLDEVDNGTQTRRSNEQDGRNSSAGNATSQRSAGQNEPPPPPTAAAATDNAPPLQFLPQWWSPEAEKELEAIAASAPAPSGLCTNGGDEEASEYGGVTLSYDHHHHPVAVNTTTLVEGYGGQQGLLQHDGVVEYCIDTNGDACRSGFHSPANAVEQQLHVGVDQYPVTVVYPSVVSSPSNDQTLTSCTMEQQDNESTKWAPPSPVASLDMPLDELKTRVRHQLEYYFSRENLAADAYLRSQMDNDQFVKVTTLASFNMIKRLTADLNLILEAIRESPVLQVNETGDKVRPIHKRCTLILREIPDGTKKEEVEQLFSGPQCPKIVSSEIVLKNIWYVNFETDEDAQKAFFYLRQKVQSFKGKPILARIKTAPIPRVPHNGPRPSVPNTLPLQSPPYPAISPSPDIATGTSQVLLSPSDSCAYANASTPFSSTSGPAAAPSFTVAPADSTNVVIDSSVNVPSSSPMCYYPSGQTFQPIGPPAAGIGAVPAPLNPSPWPSSDTGTFDLGYVLATYGYHPQGAYRPAVFLPTPSVSPACPVGPPNGGQRFAGNRPTRKPRGGGSMYMHSDRPAPQSADSTRPPPSYGRYGPGMGGRASAGGYYPDRRGSQYWNHDNVHYDNIRRRPDRYVSNNNNNNMGNFGNGVNNYNASDDTRPKRPPRVDRQGRFGNVYDNHWNNNGNYTQRPFRRASAVAAPGRTPAMMTSAGAVVGHGKRSQEVFDLHPSAFPPLPTAATGGDSEKEMATTSTIPIDQLTKETVVVVTNVEVTQPPPPREYREQISAIASSSSPVAERMKSPTTTTVPATSTTEKPTGHAASIVQEEQCTVLDTSLEIAMAKEKPFLHLTKADQKAEITYPGVGQKIVPGFSATKGGNTTIPVAIVQPNSQQKTIKVATADKATTTDLSPPLTRAMKVVEDANASKSVCDDAAGEEEKGACGIGKRLSYADMAKHAAAGRGNFVSLVPTSMLNQQKSTASATNTNTAAAPAYVSGTATAKGKEHTISHGQQRTEKDGGKSADEGEGNTHRSFVQQHRNWNKHNVVLKKCSRPLECNVGGQYEQAGGTSNVPPSSY